MALVHLSSVGKRRTKGFEFTNIIPGERGLLFAVLERAINDAIDNASDEHTRSMIVHRRQAQQWFGIVRGEHDDEPFSFLWVCEMLNLCPKTLVKFVKNEIRYRQGKE